ncbi:MAG: hypothetical protein LBV04_00295 [Deferribacteraceae bacterium]|jgi:S-adenosylmethionine:tRNA-ribosyltransferase-isomerase (queuine synthetase)|nr:hypothetical protein [Deferribacteraceae bacterium]
MTLAEKTEMALRSVALDKEGKHDEAMQLMKEIPLPPYLAKAVKDAFGADALGRAGFDLSEAEAEYGKDWLDR